MAAAKQSGDLRELIGCFLESHTGPNGVVGQLAFTPVPYLEPRPIVARAARALVANHAYCQIDFARMDDKVDFRKAHELPVAYLQLGDSEEMIALKAKMRPVVILGAAKGVPAATLPDGVERRQAQKAFDPAFWIAPIYSCSTAHDIRAFGPTLTARIKCLMYPEFVWIKSDVAGQDIEGVIRLDRLAISHLHVCTSFRPVKLTNETLGLCFEQINLLGGRGASKEYADLQYLMAALLPDAAKPTA